MSAAFQRLPSTLAYAVSADFEPEGAPEGFVEWTFLVPRSAAFGAGLFQIEHVRPLNQAEIRNGVKPAGLTDGALGRQGKPADDAQRMNQQ